MRQSLVLFDVDGTLLLTGGASSRCMRRAAERVLGERFQWEPVTPGMLDDQIFVQLAGRCGIDDATGRLAEYKRCYLHELEAELSRVTADVKVLPGVRPLLAELSQRRDVVTGLLTGNYRRAVELKFAAAGLEFSSFAVGAFAEDGQERHNLLQAAIEQYQEMIAQPADPRRVIVVGDTPRDIACAHAHGCIAFGVATGWYKSAQLLEAGADHVVEDLARAGPLIELLDG